MLYHPYTESWNQSALLSDFLTPIQQGVFQIVFRFRIFLKKLCIFHGHKAHYNEKDENGTHYSVEEVRISYPEG